MSTRAYKVVQIEYKQSESFNFHSDEEIVTWLQENTTFFETLNMDGNGIAFISVKDLKEMLKELGDSIEKSTMKAIKEDVGHPEAEYLKYYCY